MEYPQIATLAGLPQRKDDIWQGGMIMMPNPGMPSPEVPDAIGFFIWGSSKSGRILPMNPTGTSECKDAFTLALDTLLEFATTPGIGYRPLVLEMNDQALVEQLTEPMAQARIQVIYKPRLEMIEFVESKIVEAMDSLHPQVPGYLTGKKVTAFHVDAFAEAAKAFHEAAPWKHLANEDLIEIQSPRIDKALKHAVVMGNGRKQYGLGFYSSIKQYWSMYDIDESDLDDQIPEKGIWSLTFEEESEVSKADLELWRSSNMALADSNVYPVAALMSFINGVRRPSASEMAYMEGLMRALADTTEDELDSGQWTKSVQTVTGVMEFSLRLPFLLEPPTHQDLAKHGLVDRRSMERVHAQIGRFTAGKDFASHAEMIAAVNKEFAGKPIDDSKYGPVTPPEKAQDLCFQAYGAIGRRKVILARQAIDLYADCAEAHVILGEVAYDTADAQELYAAGVHAGKRALGEQFFKENVGHFWGITESRPYMRALKGLADSLFDGGQIERAIENYQEILRLNPSDNQGVRYVLLPLLIERDQSEDARQLLKKYPADPAATWAYSLALMTFKNEGNSVSARTQLITAFRNNPHVPEYLITGEQIEDLPENYSLGSPEEAMIYASEGMDSWDAVPGAIDWLEKQIRQLVSNKKSRKNKSKRNKR